MDPIEGVVITFIVGAISAPIICFCSYCYYHSFCRPTEADIKYSELVQLQLTSID